MDKTKQNACFFIDPKKRDFFVKGIRRWGKENYQHYPWREEKNLFRILLTEICLQKTDFQKVNNVFHLIRRFDGPEDTVENLEVLDELVSLIGLSYKKERILRMSFQLLERFGGRVPGNYDDLVSLHGVGDYIANAVLSFGLKKRAALVDTNTIRIVESFFGYRSPKKRSRDDRALNDILLSILPPRKYALFNSYLLDFGALQCVSNRQRCDVCLLKRECELSCSIEKCES